MERFCVRSARPRREVIRMAIVIGSQWYTWLQYYQSQGQDPAAHLDETLAEIAQAGLDAFEPSLEAPEEADRLAPLCARHHLRVPSIYSGAHLHEENWRASAAKVVERASAAAGALGTKVVVVNPDPLRWGTTPPTTGTATRDLSEAGGADVKSDAALRRQAAALAEMTGELRRHNLELAYHTHDREMRASARELHHMLLATREAGMKFCLDLHWIYRGAGNSNVALLDIIELYGARVASLHLRQSQAGVWCELLEDGDVEYRQALHRLRQLGFSGPAILEICAEAKTARTMPLVEAHRQSAAWLRHLLAGAGSV